MNKWKSRKFWVAIVGQVETIAGAVIVILATLGYLKAEKDIDVARANGGE